MPYSSVSVETQGWTQSGLSVGSNWAEVASFQPPLVGVKEPQALPINKAIYRGLLTSSNSWYTAHFVGILRNFTSGDNLKATTLPETNSKFAPENGWLEDMEDENYSFRMAHFQRLCLC